MANDIAESKQQLSLAPQNMKEALEFSSMLAKSSIIPKDFMNNAGNIMVAIQWGMELGLQPMQAMQNIAVINGRPSLWGDVVIALVKASPLCEYVTETVDDKGAKCAVKRKGEPEQVRYFTEEDAKKAGLWGKQGPWSQYPKRMMQMRARSWALRDVFPDVLRGIASAEEESDAKMLKDLEEAEKAKNAGKNVEKDITSTAEVVYKDYPADKFTANTEQWKKVIASGKKTANDMIATINSRAATEGFKLTQDQQMKIASWDEPQHEEQTGPVTVDNGEGAQNDNS